MKKGFVQSAIVFGILLVLYILIAFLVPFAKTATFWVSVVFTVVAFAVAAAAFYIAFVKTPDAKSKFYGFPIARIGVIYAIVQIVASFVFMALATFVAEWPVWPAILVYAVALGVTLIGLIAADAVVEEVQRQDVQLKKDVYLMRSLQSKLNQMTSQCDGNPDAADAVKKFAEELRFSDPVSSDALVDVERDLAAAVDELQAAVTDGDSAAVKQLCCKGMGILSESNRLCKLDKY